MAIYQLFLSNTNNLHLVAWFQVFLSNTKIYMASNILLVVTEWEITKTEVENEMEIFIASTKYNTRQQPEKSTHR